MEALLVGDTAASPAWQARRQVCTACCAMWCIGLTEASGLPCMLCQRWDGLDQGRSCKVTCTSEWVWVPFNLHGKLAIMPALHAVQG